MRTPLPAVPEADPLIERLAALGGAKARERFLHGNPGLRQPAAVQRLYEEVARRARVDLRDAAAFAKAAAWLAAQLKDELSRGYALRAEGHILFMRGKQELALRRYEAALRAFARARSKPDIGRTLNGALQTLIYLGQYKKAFAWARRARAIFAQLGDRLRLARLDTNLGNVLYRQDRFEEALQRYRSAERELRRLGEPQDVAAVLANIAVCYISLNDFPKALNAYLEARNFCQVHNLSLFVVQADYNVAYLHYLRGEYTLAIELYEAARKQSDLLDEGYHRALCDLDQSEMYLELNLVEEGEQLAHQAFLQFEKLRMGYEAAKALAFLAIALSHQGKTARALEFFRSARKRFVREENRVWPTLIDLYQALVLFEAERYAQARRLCEAASRFFAKTSLTSKSVLCELLLARLHLQMGKPRRAHKTCLAALRRLDRVEAPTLRYQAFFVLGQIEEALGDPARAQQAYERAHAGLEGLRSHLHGEELKISFLRDKLAVYESLVWLRLSGHPSRSDLQAAFAYIEFAKSRSLADLIAFRAQTLPAQGTEGSVLVERVRTLREQLSACYRRIDLEETGPAAGQNIRLERLKRLTRECEGQLLRALGELRATEGEFSSLQNAGTIPLDAVRSALGPGTVLIEFYQTRGILAACLVRHRSLEIVRLGDAAHARDLLRLLQFQLSKFRFGAEYVRSTAAMLLEATQSHLRDLYAELFAPLRDRLDARHLVIVPHNFLHYLPFHALLDGRRYLIDDYSFSYAPSASVHFLCSWRPRPRSQGSLVLGIPDPLAPHILEEVRAVASTLPAPKLFVGKEATEECLRTHGPRSRYIHIATHGLFRQDNPMFSSLRLGNSQLTLFDLYQLQLPAELVTLSGCGTGLNVVVAGDELLGLVRGLLYAGAQALLVTLWDVSDRSTTEFMKTFYARLQTQPDRAAAVKHAMLEIRERYPHPYYWAPFALVGQAAPA